MLIVERRKYKIVLLLSYFKGEWLSYDEKKVLLLESLIIFLWWWFEESELRDNKYRRDLFSFFGFLLP